MLAGMRIVLDSFDGIGHVAGADGELGDKLHRAGRTGLAGPRCAFRGRRAGWQPLFWRRISARCKPTCCRRKPRSGTAFARPWNRPRRWSKAESSSCAMCIFWTRATRPRPQDTQFFCSNATGSLTVTITMNALPPGRYAVVLADAAGAPLAGQMGLILAWDGAATQWKLAGLTVRPGVFDGHDGVWYWQRARELAKTDPVERAGSATTRRATCCCRWTFSSRRIWKSCTRSSR